jgi:DNA-directed RNA polymerase specialized sigma24 family protein
MTLLGFVAASMEPPEWLEDAWDSGKNPELWLYRKRTGSLLRRYFRMSVEMGRLPSILGQEFFRSKVTSYSVSSFEDVVIFIHDVEHSLGKLDSLSQQLIARVILQGFSYDETARLVGCCRRTVDRKLPDALDRLSEIFIEVGILEKFDEASEVIEEVCQEGEEENFFVIM